MRSAEWNECGVRNGTNAELGMGNEMNAEWGMRNKKA